MSFADLQSTSTNGIVAAQGMGMKVYWVGLAGWLLILGVQLLLARAASAKRRNALKSAINR
jgi:hypothetical protein